MANSAAVILADDGQDKERARGTLRPGKREVVAPDASQAPMAQYRERIKVVGVGGAGNNALDNIIREGVMGVELLAINTDAHCLDKCLAVEKLVIGEKLTSGHGAGSNPEVGEKAALESKELIRECLKGADMVYLAAGMGGGTGTGATHVIAKIAKEMGALTVAVVTRPFSFEGKRRSDFAENGIEKLKGVVDALIVIPNERLLTVTEKNATVTNSFKLVDNVLRQAVQGVTDLITKPGMINVDFADVRSIMHHAGGAVMGIGVGSGEHRADDALRRAIESPLMDTSIAGAKGVILNVTAHPNVGVHELHEAANKLQDMIDMDAVFKWGFVPDEQMGEQIKMVVIATGFEFEGGDPTPPQTRPATRATADNHASSYTAVRQTQQPMKITTQLEMTQIEVSDDMSFNGDDPFDTPAYLRRSPIR